MARAKFKKRDRNRFRKTYPYMRTRPVQEYMAGKETIWEAQAVTFNNENSVEYTFLEAFPAAPIVTATAMDNEGNGGAGVNVLVTSVTAIKVVITTSETFTGTVHMHAIYIKSGAA
jgi:hypothetical protein